MLNSGETTVNMVFFEATLPLFLVLFGALVMGALLGAGALFIIYRLREKEARERAEREQAKHSGKKGKGSGSQDGSE